MVTDKPSRKLFRGAPFLILVLGGLGSLGLSSLRQPPETRSVKRLPPVVETVPVGASPSRLTLEAEGEVVPYREVTLSAEVAGRIQSKSPPCRAGHFVKAGDMLLTIDPRDYDLKIEQIQQSVKQTEVNVEELDVEQENVKSLMELAESDQQLADNELQRIQTLLQQRASSQSSLDTARRGQIQAQNVQQTLANQLSLLRTRRGRFLREKDRLLVELQQAVLDRERTEIHAPIDGIVVQDWVEQDDYVQPGTALVRVEDIAQVEVLFDLKLEELRWIWGGDPAQAAGAASETASSYQLPPLPITVTMELHSYSYRWNGVLSRYDGAGLNPATRTVPCVAVVEDPRAGCLVGQADMDLPGPPALLRGMFVTVRLDVPTRLPLVEVPTIALRPGNRLWLLRNDRLVIQDVDVALVRPDRTLLVPGKPGLVVGEQVIVSPLALAVHGMELRSEEAAVTGAAEISGSAPASIPQRSATTDISAEVTR